MNTRQAKLLSAIIDQFIQTAVPVGSQNLLQHSNFCLSCATIRNEMRSLGEEGFLEQPHVSAGRVPTAKGYRIYVREFMQPSAQEKQVQRKFDALKERYFQQKDQELAYETVTLLAHMIPNVAFTTVPHKPQVYYLGLANALRQPEFQLNPQLATSVVEILEARLTELLERVSVDEHVLYLIGEEHVLPQIQSCGLLLTSYRLRGEEGVIGILGPMRMDYAYNTVALRLAAEMLRGI